MADSKEHVVAICPMQGEGQHTLVVLTDRGRLFERVADPKQFNTGPNAQRAYLWRELKGPLDG